MAILKTKKGITVIICCYNSQSRITQTLEHLKDQGFNGDWEIILVDNNCTDNTITVAKEVWGKKSWNIPLIIIQEDTPGLNHARLKGIHCAKYEYIVFCDDDNWLDKDYLSIVYNTLNEKKNVAALGGRCIPVSNKQLPDWLSGYHTALALGTQGKKTGDVTMRKYLWGAGLSFRKSLFNKLYHSGFNFLTSDRTAKGLGSGGDSEMCRWFILDGSKLWYDENLILHHFIPQERLTRQYVNKVIEGIKLSQEILNAYDVVTNYKKQSKSMINRLIACIISTAYLVYFYGIRNFKLVHHHKIRLQLYLSWIDLKLDDRTFQILQAVKRLQKAPTD